MEVYVKTSVMAESLTEVRLSFLIQYANTILLLSMN